MPLCHARRISRHNFRGRVHAGHHSACPACNYLTTVPASSLRKSGNAGPSPQYDIIWLKFELPPPKERLAFISRVPCDHHERRGPRGPLPETDFSGIEYLRIERLCSLVLKTQQRVLLVFIGVKNSE